MRTSDLTVSAVLNTDNSYDVDASVAAYRTQLTQANETRKATVGNIRTLVSEIFAEAGNPSSLAKGAIEHSLMIKLGANAETWTQYQKLASEALPSMLIGGVSGCRFVSEQEASDFRAARAARKAAKAGQ